MLVLAVIVVAIGLSATALLVLAAAAAAERAIRLAAVERRRDHWRRLGEACQDVQRAADDYQRAMASELQESGGNGEGARRARRVSDAAHDYREASRRLARVLAACPRPPRSRRQLSQLADDRAPEPGAAARPADLVLAELAVLQDALDAEATARDPAAPVWRLRAAVRLAGIDLRARLRAARRA